MSDAIREQLSAFVDGELSPAEAELLLKRVDRDPTLRAALDRYMLLGAAVRSQVTYGPSGGFAARVATAIADEKAGDRPAWASRWLRKSQARWTKSMTGGAVAAGVVALTMLLLPRMSNDGALPTADVTIASAGSSTGQSLAAPTGANGPTVIPAEVVRAAQLRQQAERYSNEAPALRVENDSRLATYVMAHSQYSSPLSRRNVLTGLLVDEADEAVSTDSDALDASRAYSSQGNQGDQSDRAVAIR